MNKSYIHRANVRKWLSHWKHYMALKGKEHTFDMLNKSKTTHLSRKDELGLIQALGLSITDKK